jgi:hypothetical protein
MKISLDSIISGFKSVTTLVSNFGKIQTDLNDKVLYRDNPEGEPNQMENLLDMNGYAIINQSNPVTVDGFNWEGDWSSLTAYSVGDAVHLGGTAYLCVLANTNQTPPNVTYWQVVAEANLPDQTGHADKVLTTDGAVTSWESLVAQDVDFTNTGTGATSRTVRDKLEEGVYVEDFGAVGDGVTDDTQAFVDAFAASLIVRGTNGKTYVVGDVTPPSGGEFHGNACTIVPPTGASYVFKRTGGGRGYSVYDTDFNDPNAYLRVSTTVATAVSLGDTLVPVAEAT